jgi:predicted dehydrogenase
MRQVRNPAIDPSLETRDNIMPQANRPEPRPASRRQFLARSGAIGALSTMALAGTPAVHAAENNTIKLALVGCGGRGTGAVVDAFAASGGPVKLYAMADLFEHRLRSSLGNLQKAHADKVDVTPERTFLGFDAFRKAIDCLDAGDVVILTTSSAFRPQHFEYAVNKGLHVFMEKSLAVDAPANRRLLAAAEASEKKNLKVGVGFMWRHCQARQELMQRIHDGAIGEVNMLRIYRVHGPVYIGRRTPEQSELSFQLQRPVSFNWLTGGFFVDWHCHNVDIACWAKNAWPISAQGMGGRCYPEAGNLFDHYTVEYTFADGAKLFSFSRHMNGCWQTYADYAHGSKGSAVIMTSLAAAKPKIYRSQRMVDSELQWSFDQPEPSPYRREWQVLLDAIRQDAPHNEARRGAEANLATLMGRMAVHSGAMVTWDEALASTFEYTPNVDGMTFDTPAPVQPNADGLYEPPQPGRVKAV